MKMVVSKPLPSLTASDIHRFKSKIMYTADPEKCWNWIGYTHRGYGKFSVTISPQKDIPVISTRVAYFLHTKIDPVGNAVLHTCDNPSCCNPAHLFLGSNKQNTCDMMSKGRGVHPKGSHHGKSKLTERDILEIKQKYVKGNGQELAIEYGVGQSVISMIINNKAWTHV